MSFRTPSFAFFLTKFPSKSGVITFSQHPEHTLSNSPPETITSLEERVQLLAGCGIDYLAVLPFNQEIANQEAEPFIQSIYKTLRPSRIVLGYDSRLGKGGLGTAQTLRPFAASLGISLEEVPPYRLKVLLYLAEKFDNFLERKICALQKSFLGDLFLIQERLLMDEESGHLLDMQQSIFPLPILYFL